MKHALVPLGQVADFVRGVTYKPEDLMENFADGTVVCMRTANIQVQLDESDLRSIPASLVKSNYKLLREGDILVSTANSWNLVGKCCWVPKLTYAAAPGGFIAALRADPAKIEPRYLYHWFNSPKTQANARNCGRQTTNISNMDLSRCLALQTPLPELTEQRRIAAILDKADALRTKRREALVKLDQLVQSVFLEMLGDPVSNSMGWKMARFGEVTESRLGKMLDKRTSQGAYMKPYLANLNVQWGRFEIDSLRTMNFDPDDQVEFALRDGDLLMCEGGEPGRCAVWRGQVKDCYYQKALHRIRCDLDRCVPEYIQYLFWFLAKAGAFRDSVASATIAHLPGVKLKAISIPLPPISLQQRFSQVVNEILKEKSLQSVSGAELDKFFESLQQQAFSGSL